MHQVVISRGDNFRQEYAVAEPMTVREWVTLNIGEDFATPMICLYQGQPLLRAQWDVTVIEEVVIFIPLALGGGGGGGGKNPLAMIGMVIVMVVAVIAQQYWVPGALAGTAFAAGGAYAGVGSALGYMASAAIMAAGSMLVNAVFPTKPPAFNSNIRELESASPTYSHSISQNQARLYQMIPECFGTNEQVPDLAAQPWAEFAGNEQYLHLLLAVGLGYYDIHRVSIEDTAIWENGKSTDNFPEIEIEIVNPGEKITLFPDNIETSPEVSGQTLNQGTIGPFVANSAGTLASALSLDVIFTRGLGKMNQDPDEAPIIAHSVSVSFEYQRIDDFGAPIGGWTTLAAKTYRAATQTPQRYTIFVKVPEGRFQVRGRVTSGGQENPYLMNEVAWGGLKTYLPSKLVYPDLTLIAIRARATNALSQGSARQFQVLHTRKLPAWTPETGWAEPQPTNSWAWAMAAMAKAQWGGRRTDRQIDLDALHRIDRTLTMRDDEFNHVLDTRQSIWDLFGECCRCVRVIPRAILSTMSWIRDEPGRPVRGVFTPYNIARGSFSVDYKFFTEDSPDDVFVEYRDKEGWTERDVRAMLPDSLSLEPARKNFVGITRRQQAYNEAYFEAACNAYRRTFLAFSTEMEGRLLFRGDMILVTHPLGGESAWAGVRGWDQEGGILRLDTTIETEGDYGNHYIVLRRPDGTSYGPVKVAGLGEKTVELDAASLAAAEAKEAAKDTYVPIWQWLSDGKDRAATTITFGQEEPGTRAIVLAVKPRPNGVCDIEAVVEDDRVHEHPGDAPPWNPGGEIPAASNRPVIEGMVPSFDFGRKTLALRWSADSRAVKYQIQYRSYEDGEGWSEWNDLDDAASAATAFVVPLLLVEYRVRGVSGTVAGAWLTAQADCSVAMPGVVTLELAAPYEGKDLSLIWKQVAAQEIHLVLSVDGAEVARKTFPGDAVAGGATAGELAAVGGPWPEFTVVAVAISGSWPATQSEPLHVLYAVEEVLS